MSRVWGCGVLDVMGRLSNTGWDEGIWWFSGQSLLTVICDGLWIGLEVGLIMMLLVILLLTLV